MALSTTPAEVIDLGQTIFSYGNFDAVNAVTLVLTPTDPSVITVKYEKPDATFVTKVYLADASVIRDSVGRFHDSITPDQVGDWWVKWTGTGAAAGIVEYYFRVVPNQVP